jgi:hypothetical protein
MIACYPEARNKSTQFTPEAFTPFTIRGAPNFTFSRVVPAGQAYSF